MYHVICTKHYNCKNNNNNIEIQLEGYKKPEYKMLVYHVAIITKITHKKASNMRSYGFFFRGWNNPPNLSSDFKYVCK